MDAQRDRQLSLSVYADNLPNEAKRRYKEKIAVINGLDPFGGCLGEEIETLPPVEASDFVAYLVLQTNFITTQQFKAHKSLEAYNQFVCGWVKDVHTFKVAGKFVTTGRVSPVVLHIDFASVCVCVCHCVCVCACMHVCTSLATCM